MNSDPLEIGAPVIFDGERATGSYLHRQYGLVESTGPLMVHIRLATGESVRRPRTRVAACIQPPPNWPELYRKTEVRKRRENPLNQ